MTTKQTKTMTITQAFRKRFDTLEMRANGVEIDDDDSASIYELTLDGRKALGGFAAVSHDEYGITVKIAIMGGEPNDVTIPFDVSDHIAFWGLIRALRETAPGETLASRETAAAPKPAIDQSQEPEWVAEIRKENAERQAAEEARLAAEHKAEGQKNLAVLKQKLADFGLTATSFAIDETDNGNPVAEIDGVHFTADRFRLYVGLPCLDLAQANPEDYGPRVWRKVGDRSEIPGALDGIRYEISTARARINRPVAPPKPKVEVKMIALHEGGCGISEGVAEMQALAAQGYKVAGFDGGWVIMQRVNEGN